MRWNEPRIGIFAEGMSPAPAPQAERLSYMAAALAVLALVCWRAATMPWVHDECASLFWYVERGQWLPGIAHWDANNHVLSTLIGLAGYKLFGLSLLGSRVGSVLAFILWAAAAWRIGRRVDSAFVRATLLAALLLCPFLLDFFSLFRGYGLEMAFWLLAIDGLMRYQEARMTSDLVQLLLAMILANAAVLALVPLWAIFLLAASAWAVRSGSSGGRARQLTAIALLGMLPLAVAAWLSFELKERGLLYHGTLDGFVEVSIVSLNRYVLGSGSLWLAWCVLILMAAATIVGWLKRQRELLLCAGIFWADAVARIGMAHLLGVNYPEDRAALHLLPLMIIAIAFGADALAAASRHAQWAALLLLLLPARSILFSDPERTLLWPEQHINRSITDGLANASKGLDRPVVVGSYHQTFLSMPYAMRVNGHETVVPISEGFPHGLHDVRLADGRFLEPARMGCTELGADGPLTWLTCGALGSMTLEWEKPLNIPAGSHEFVELLHPDTLEPGAGYAIELDAAVRSTGYLDLHLVVELGEEEGRSTYRDDVPLALYRPVWNGERLRLFRTFTTRSPATRQVVYLWNPIKDDLVGLKGSLRLHRIASP